MCASNSAGRDRENAAKKEAEFQALTKNYQELQTRVEGGRFTQQEARVGSKRSAPDEPLESNGVSASATNIWDQFGDFMKASYNNDSFAPPIPRVKQ
jgi:hypothetical protein